jgi:alpha-L-fucosidase
MDKYGDTIYGADPCDVKNSVFANFTRKGDTLYVHVLFWPGPEWSIGGLQTKVGSAVLLPSRQPMKFEQNDFRVRFRDLPAEAPDELITVLELECESVPKQHDYRTMFNSTNMSRGKV